MDAHYFHSCLTVYVPSSAIRQEKQVNGWKKRNKTTRHDCIGRKKESRDKLGLGNKFSMLTGYKVNREVLIAFGY